MFLDSFQEVDQWMLFLSRNGVREFHLVNTNQRYELPSYVFSCLELRALTLDNCLFKPPLKFDGFFKLENLNLRDINFVASSVRTHINLPKLKSLTLTSCTNLCNFNIKATKLQILRVLFCPGAMLLRLLMHSQRILWVTVFIKSAIQDIVQVERINLTRILSNLPTVSIFNGCFLKLLIAERIPKWLPHPVNSLKRLNFFDLNFGDLDQLQGALCLLRNSPNLEKLRIDNVQRYDTRVDFKPLLRFVSFQEPQLNDSDAGPVLTYLESPDGLDQTLNLLKIVEIENIEGSRPELHFIKLLLAHSPSLEKFTIQPCGTSLSNQVFNIAFRKKEERFNIAKDVMQFPRVSQKVEMIFLDPEP
ncbi:F-box domain, FBD domain, Leucine-rich repeat domain, L domain-like protein [Artemisia annua]|uniref:F-box domain, FBD domain, Leucine-rich repeat domain, L domain-like protein n=1 Tax=Artemisia annua TaxID=35608 RepID=A0A2U1MPQ0_ARTAN|nr:F-box domain, FBD domain, Leucine-rich repeat domain, L domain-like protein [Artemisia annua]